MPVSFLFSVALLLLLVSMVDRPLTVACFDFVMVSSMYVEV